VAYAFFYFNFTFLLRAENTQLNDVTSIIATAIEPAISRVCIPVLIASSNWLLRSAVIVLYMPAPGTSGINPGIRKIGTGFLRNLANISDSTFIASAAKKTDKICVNPNRNNNILTNQPHIPFIPQYNKLLLGEFVRMAKEKLTMNAEIN